MLIGTRVVQRGKADKGHQCQVVARKSWRIDNTTTSIEKIQQSEALENSIRLVFAPLKQNPTNCCQSLADPDGGRFDWTPKSLAQLLALNL